MGVWGEGPGRHLGQDASIVPLPSPLVSFLQGQCSAWPLDSARDTVLPAQWHPRSTGAPGAAGTCVTWMAWCLQENVSCLNTSLVILMLARRKERLPLYLRLLQRMEHSKKYPGFLLNNFHNLLRFWQQHYLHKDKDSTCLENVSAPPLRGGGRAAGTQTQGPSEGHLGSLVPAWTLWQAALCPLTKALPTGCWARPGSPRRPPSPSLFAQSSCISFSYWKETVSILLNPDRQSPSALVSYIEEPYMDIDRDFTEE